MGYHGQAVIGATMEDSPLNPFCPKSTRLEGAVRDLKSDSGMAEACSRRRIGFAFLLGKEPPRRDRGIDARCSRAIEGSTAGAARALSLRMVIGQQDGPKDQKLVHGIVNYHYRLCHKYRAERANTRWLGNTDCPVKEHERGARGGTERSQMESEGSGIDQE